MPVSRTARVIPAFLAIACSAVLLVPAAASAAQWSAQPTPNEVVPNGQLLATSCVSASRCVAVGSSATSAGTSPLAEAWNGTTWRILPTPALPGATHGVLTGVSCAVATACVAVGHDVTGSGSEVTLAESWNGAAWTLLATANQPGVSHNTLAAVSCASATSCVAVGNDNKGKNPGSALMESWNGTAWTLRQAAIPPSAVYSSLAGVSCPAATACTAVGSYLDSSSDDWLTLAETWDGSTWAVRATPNPPGAIRSTLNGVSCSSASACTATGGVINGGSARSTLGDTLAESWNGSAWSIQVTPNPDTTMISALYGVSCTSADACSAVGYYIPSVGPGRRTLAESWNGSAWAIQPAAGPPDMNSSLAGVSCPATANCAAVGRNQAPSGTEVVQAEWWNGSKWAISQAPSPSGAVPSVLDGISCASARACTAVGFYISNSFTRTLAEQWNGTSWQVQPTPDPRGVSHSELSSVSCASATACVAVGESYNNEGHPHLLAERWNGKAWTGFGPIPVPPGDGTRLQGVSCSAATACTAVGYYETTTIGAVSLAERWNGTSWTLQTVPTPAGGSSPDLEAVSCRSATACTAVGYYDVSGSGGTTLAERWNGSTWAVEPTPANVTGVLYGVTCATATTCTAAGDGYSFPAGLGPLALAWRNGTWRVQQTVNPPGSAFTSFYGASCPSVTDCAAVGGYHTSTAVSVPLAEAWNGAAWTQQTVPSNLTENTVLAAVSARPGGGFTAVGSHANAAGVSTTLAVGRVSGQ